MTNATATRTRRADWIIVDLTHLHWPGRPSYPSTDTPRGRGYRTEDEPYARIEQLELASGRMGRDPGSHCMNGPELRVVRRG